MFPLCEYVYCRLKPELWAVCIDKTHEYLSRAIIWPCSLAPLALQKYSLCFSFCACTFIFSPHVNDVTSCHLCGRFHPISLFLLLTSTHSSLSSLSFCSNRKVKDTLPLFRQFFSSAFSLTYVSLASMKLPPDVLRCLAVSPLISILICSPFIQTCLQ